MNRKITCAIIDDNLAVIHEITSHLEKFSAVEIVHTNTDAREAQCLLTREPVDLLFVDIEMPGMTGIELVQSLLLKPKVVFITAHMQYAATGFDLEVVDCLIKPVPFDRFAKAMHRVFKLLKMEAAYLHSQEVKNDYIKVKSVNLKMWEQLFFDEIVFIESQKNYVEIHLLHRVIITRMSLKDLRNELPGRLFIQPHRSFIVAKKVIKKITSEKIELIGREQIIPVTKKINEGFV